MPPEERYLVGAKQLPDGTLDTSRAMYMEVPSSKEKTGENRDKKFISTEESLESLKEPTTEREPYDREKMEEERPYTHYTPAGNIFQVLRFGIQSRNYKNRLNELRPTSGHAEEISKQMCGLRVRQGGSYQTGDSVSLSKFNDSIYIPPGNVLVLVSPDKKVFGEDPSERDSSQGYGHGVKRQVLEGEYEIGNSAAYPNEVLAANIVLPQEIRAIVVDQYTRFLSALSRFTLNNVALYMQERNKNPKTGEDILATARLISEMAGESALVRELEELEATLPSLKWSVEITKKVIAIQKEALKKFVGEGNELNEDTLRSAIGEKFGISFIEK